MKLRTLCFEDDDALDRRIRQATNGCDEAHLYVATFGIAHLILSELMPFDLDGCGRLTLCANTERNDGRIVGYHTAPELGVSWYNLDRATSRRLYDFSEFDEAFADYTAGLVLDVLAEADRANGGRNRLAERRDELLDKLRACGFRKEMLLEKHSKLRRDRKYRAKVCRCIGHGIGDAIRTELIDCATGETVVSKWLCDELPNTIDMAGAIYKTGWNGNAFEVTFHRTEPSRTETVELPDDE